MTDRDLLLPRLLYVYRDRPEGSLYVTATLCMGNGEEITGRCLSAALRADRTRPRQFRGISRGGKTRKRTSKELADERLPI